MEELVILEVFNDTDQSDDDLEEGFLLHVLREQNLGNRGDLYGRFNLLDLSEIECKRLFRFKRNDIGNLSRALGIPEQIRTSTRVSVTGKC